MRDLIDRLPKAELHIHIEGSLEPEMMFRLAERNQIELPYDSVDQVRSAYRFTDLQSFLDIYYRAAAVLRTPDDFYDLMAGYLERAASDGVRRAEIFFDPQTHTERGIDFPVFMEGFAGAMADAPEGLSTGLILCFLRHLSGEDAVDTLRRAEPYLDGVIGVGLDSSEKGRPPVLFEDAFNHARRLGLRTVAHAGEEGPAEYVVSALDVLGAERIDHGIRSLEDPELVERLVLEQVPLTVCPLSNVALQVVPDLVSHPLPTMLDAGLQVSVNSDDPAYFGGYIGDNYQRVAAELGLVFEDIADIARMSITSSFLSEDHKIKLVDEIGEVVASAGSETVL